MTQEGQAKPYETDELRHWSPCELTSRIQATALERDSLKTQVERLHNALKHFIKAHGIKRDDDPAWSFATVDMYEFEHAEKALKET